MYGIHDKNERIDLMRAIVPCKALLPGPLRGRQNNTTSIMQQKRLYVVRFLARSSAQPKINHVFEIILEWLCRRTIHSLCFLQKEAKKSRLIAALYVRDLGIYLCNFCKKKRRTSMFYGICTAKNVDHEKRLLKTLCTI